MAQVTTTPPATSVATAPSTPISQPIATNRFNWIVILLASWFVGGLFIDGWAHNNLPGSLETFFTPWHAVFYSGFSAVALFLIANLYLGHRQGLSWRRALPQGYDLSLLGIIVFSLGGVGDMLWHEILGIETGIEALFSPTHLLLAAGIALIVSGPLRAAAHRRLARGAQREIAPMTAIVSATMLYSVLSFMGQFANLTTEPWIALGRRPSGANADLGTVLGVLGVLVPSALLMGTLLYLVKRWRLPAGGATLVILLNALLMGIMVDETLVVPAALLTSIAAELLVWRLRPAPERPWAFHTFAFLVPTLFITVYLFLLLRSASTWWSPHMLYGLPFIAGAAGLLISGLTSETALADRPHP